MTRRNQDQAARRRSVRMRDQHGRQWGFTIDTETMAPVGAPAAVGWSWPQLPGGKVLVPPQKYLVFNPEDLGAMTIDYDAWLNDLEQLEEKWEGTLASFATNLYADRAQDVIDAPTPYLLSLCGPRPFPSALVLAAKDEDPWALGLPKDPAKGSKSRKHEPPPSVAAAIKQMGEKRRRINPEEAPEMKKADLKKEVTV